MRKIILVGTAALGLAACNTDNTDGTPPSRANTAESCGAEGLQDLIGQPQSVLDKMRFSQTMRVITLGTRVSMDYAPTRLNIYVNAQGIITRLKCG